MQVWRTAAGLTALDELRSEGPLVLVPTMGALHEGHLSLVRHGRDLGPVVATIFVNPTQFGPGEDFDSYPRDLEADLAMLEPLGVRGVFAPSVHEIYGNEGEVFVKAGRRAHDLCGSGRPGHFDGVLTVVAKLFGLVKPDVAVFGRKDAQQCLVIDQMVNDLKMGIRLIDAPTLREPEGLAMSSRNHYLEPEDRERALALSRVLNEASKLIEAGERRTDILMGAMADGLEVCDSLEYAEVRSVPDLENRDLIQGRTLLAVAARVEPARLIDNLVLEVGPDTVTEASLLGT